MRPLEGRIILLCDASESADALVAAGARVFLVELSATAVAKAIARIGHNDADGLDAAPSDPTAIERAITRATRRFGVVHVAVMGPLWRSQPIPAPTHRLEPQRDPADLIADITSILG